MISSLKSLAKMVAGAAMLSTMALGMTTPSLAKSKYPLMTILIYNNSKSNNIYPVLSTGAATTGKWLQAYAKVPRKDLDKLTYEKVGQFRLYLAAKGDGIPPGGVLRLKLPLATQLVKKPDGRKPNQYADWWGGARIEIFSAPAASHKPPKELTEALKDRPTQTVVTPIDGADLPNCVAGCTGDLVIYHDKAGLEHNLPLQLTEFTLGAIIDSKKNDTLEINANNVDYDVSYVDTAYMPVAMEPFDNDQVGYVGMITTVEQFDKAVEKFLKQPEYKGWPLFVTKDGDTIQKVPSPLNIFGRNLDAKQPDLTSPPWAPMDALVTDYKACVNKNEQRPRCDRIRTIKEMFDANLKKYNKNFDKWNCKEQHRASGDLMSMIGHIYGWTPFNDGCGDASLNLLEQTDGYSENNNKRYREVKELFDKLQYEKDGQFDPYALLIHGKDYINAPNVYAYSVDDAVGNMQVDGRGLIFAVGGKRGLPNGEPATPPIHIALGSDEKAKVNYTDYQICGGKKREINPDYTAFEVSMNKIDGCVLKLWDNNKRVYRFSITQQPPFPQIAKWDERTAKVVDCKDNEDDAARKLCERAAFGYTRIEGREVVHTVVYPPPVQPAQKNIDVSIGNGPNDKVQYTRIGVCSATPDKQFNERRQSFALTYPEAKGCIISLRDSKDREYQFEIETDKLPFPRDATNDVIDCSGNKDADAKRKCKAAVGYSSGEGDQREAKVIFPAPDQQ